MKSPTVRSSPTPSWIRPLLLGLCVGVVSTTLLLLAMAFLLKSVELPDSAIPPMAVGAITVGSFLSGLVAAVTAGKRGLVTGALCGGALFLLLLVVGLGRADGVDATFAGIKLALLPVAGALGGLLGIHKKTGR